MISIKEFLYKNIWMPSNHYLIEMATIAKDKKWGNEHYRIAVHGVDSGDRANPHIHIYYENDTKPYNKFNFEISLIDILCYDEINLIYQRDKSRGKLISNKNKCSWEGYRKLYNEFEDWLYSNNVDLRGDYIDNLDALIWNYNQESEGHEKNHILKYILDHGQKVLDKYKKYFSEEDQNQYKKCFNN